MKVIEGTKTSSFSLGFKIFIANCNEAVQLIIPRTYLAFINFLILFSKFLT